MTDQPSISEAERVVMEVLWEGSPRTSQEVIDALRDTDWNTATIKTLLNRLLKKGALAHTRDGRRYRYRPLISREAYQRAQTDRLIDGVFGGRLAPLVAAFADHRGLSEADRRELRALLEAIDDDE